MIYIQDFLDTVLSNINALTPGELEFYTCEYLILMIGYRGISCEIARRWMSLDLTDDRSTLVQVMA